MPGFRIVTSDHCKSVEPSGPSNTLETARKHRYNLAVLEPLGTADSGILLHGYKCGRPTIEFDEIMIHNAQDEIARPGKNHWKPVEFTFYEVLQGEAVQTNLAAALLYKWWAATMVDVETSLHKPPSSYLKNCQLDMLDGAEGIVWTYELYDAWPLRVTPSDLDYSESAIADITVTLRYAKARERSLTSVSRLVRV